jgi:polysaccharide biosynthesis protein PslG
MRRIVTAAVSALLSVGLIAVVLPSSAHAAPRPTNDLVGTTVHRDLFGMHVFNLQDGQWPTVPVGAIRLWDNATTWGQIETAPGVFDWTNLDTAVATAEKNGVNDILMVLAGTPRWATDNPSSGGLAGVLPGAAGMPRNIGDWDDWVRAVVTRYKGRITSYQPWNEANLSTFSTGSAKQMAQLTKHAYDIVKSIDPAATVVAPSTGTRLSGPFKKFYPAYLSELKALGWPVDAWSAHTYPASLGTPVDRAKLAQMYLAVLRAAGAPDLPVWDTENNFGLAGPGAQNPDQDINGSRAASWTARTYLDALRLGISRVYWYSWQPFPAYLDLLGIQMSTGTPGAVAYKTLQDWIVGATYNGCKGSAKVTCTFTKDGVTSKIVWAQAGRAVFATRGFSQVCSLDGTCKAAKKKIRVAGPVQLRK